MKPVVLGITGASGAIYGVRILQELAALGIDVHLVVTRWGRRTIEHETKYSMADLTALAATVVPEGDQTALVASGSFRTAGMIVAPCSAKSLAAIAHGLSDNLLVRAADVTLKERRRLLLLVRETPLHEAHLNNMLAVTRMGGVVMPPVPAFYQRPGQPRRGRRPHRHAGVGRVRHRVRCHRRRRRPLGRPARYQATSLRNTKQRP